MNEDRERDNGEANSDQWVVPPSHISVERVKPRCRFSPVCLSVEDKSRKWCQCADDDPAESFRASSINLLFSLSFPKSRRWKRTEVSEGGGGPSPLGGRGGGVLTGSGRMDDEGQSGVGLTRRLLTLGCSRSFAFSTSEGSDLLQGCTRLHTAEDSDCK